MGNSLFKKGFDVSRENQKKQEAARANRNKLLFDFFLSKSGDEADVRFLTEEPVNYMRHTIPNGDKYDNYTCSGENCPLCARGDKPKAHGAFILIDRREYSYKDREGNERSGKNQVRFYSQGTRVLSQLDRNSTKYGLTNRDYTIIRLGSGTSTTYTFERGDEERLSADEIRECMPPSIADKYDGTMDSLYSIVEDQLMMRTYDYEPEEDEEEISSSASNIISADELPFGDPVEEKKKVSTGKSLFKKPQNCLKPRTTAKDILPFK